MIETKKNYNIGIVGSTGAVGEMMLAILEERKFPVGELRLFCSERSAGTSQAFRGKNIKAQTLEEESFEGLDFCLFSAGGTVSRTYAPLCAAHNCIAIDNTNAFRMDPEIPLVVPEVNSHDLKQVENRSIIANPNCSTIQMVVALAPIHAEFNLKRVIVSTYQSTSGAGKRAIEELSSQVVAMFNGKEPECSVFKNQIAFNCIPHIDLFEENGFTKEEMKITNETRKILHEPDLAVSATAVRVPTFCSHSESVFFETEEEASVEDIQELLGDAPGVCVIDEPHQSLYPVPFDAIGRDEVFVGRIRKDLSHPTGIHLWVVADNLRKGAALNAVQIAETLIRTVH